MSINKETPSAPQDDFVAATGYPVFARSYSRRLELEGESNRRETRIEALDRSLGAMAKIGRLTPQESQAIRSQALQSRVFPSGRWMWVGGTDWVEQPENYAGAYNCSSTEVCDTAAFGLLMDLAMTGCGTGAVLESRCIDRLPPIRNQISVSVVGRFGDQDPGNPDTIFAASDDGDHVTIQVGDSRKGWVSAYQGLIELAMDDRLVSDLSVTVDISHVRPMGRPLKGFGGVANPSKLPELFPRVARILNGALGRKLNAEECCLLIDEAAIVVVSGNIRRCLPEDALVHTANGLVPIKDVQVGDFVQTPIGFRRVTNKFDQGTQDVYEIETNATVLRSTLNHRHAVFADAGGAVKWKAASDLDSDDRLMHNTHVLPGSATCLPPDFTAERPAQSNTAKSIIIPDLIPDVAWLVGYTHGNGYVSTGRNKHGKPFGNVSWSMNAAHPDLMDAIRAKIDRSLFMFGLQASHQVVRSENTGKSICSSIRLAEYFYRHIKQPNTPLQVPGWILQGNSEIRAAYLAGLMDSDGSIVGRPPILVTTIYHSFSRQVGAVLSSLGIAGRMRVIRPEKDHWSTRYNITIPALKSQYNALIAPHSVKGAIHEGLKMYGFNVPAKLVREVYSCSHLQSLGFVGNRTTPVNYESYVSKLGLSIDIPVTVKGLGALDHVQTYDIEVEEAHCFYADGYLTHNSAGIRQFDASAPLLKDNLWVEVDGKWRIDPDRDALRAANHTRVYHEKPGEAECIEAVRKQFRSGEGAIQYAPEAIARASGDLLNTDALRRKFLDAYSSSGGRLAATEFLMSVLPEMSEQELSDRLHRYGFNPCFGAGTNILTRDEHGFPTHSPIESLIGKTVEVFDGLQWVEINNFRVTGHDQPMIRVILGCGESVRTTLYHDFILEDGTRRQAKDLVVGDRLLHVPDEDDNDVSWMFTVKSIAPDGVDTEVYCCTVPTTHQITLECGLITGQCGEIVMSNNFCNLAEVHLNQIDPLDIQGQIDAFKAAALLAAPLLHHDLSQVDARYQYSRSIDPIVGVSFTGLFDFFVQAFGVDWLRWWEAGRPEEWKPAQDNLALWSATNCFPEEPGNIYKRIERWYLATWNAVVHKATWDYCDRHGLRRPNRCTTVQPAGSKSLLTGASPGWHPPKAARFIRRITFAKNDPIALACLDYGYSVVPSQSDKDENGDLLTDPFDPRCTEWLVEIPVAVSWADLPGADTIAIEQFSALAQFDFYMQVQSRYTTHNCFARNTQFLTSEGVKTFESFEAGDTVTVLNADGDWVPATVVNTADERPMLAITVREGRTGKEKTITSTPCHRFPVRRPSGGKNKIKVVQAKDLKIGHRLVLNSADLSDLDEDGIRHGIVFGDGSLRKNKPNPGECLKVRLYLCGDKRHLQSHFEGCDIHQRDDIDQTLIRGLPSKWKCLPSNDCSQSYVAGFIAGFLAADGNISGFTISICTGRQAVVDWIRDQSPRIGVRVTGVQWLERDGCGAFQIRFSRPTFPENMVLRHHHMEHFRRSHTSRPRQWRIIDIQDAAPQVGWCVMEPVTNHFTLSDNILVMNTSATIELREHEIEPLGRRIHQAIQDDEGYISAALLARYDNLQTFPRLPFEPISRETYEQLSMNMVMRRKPGTFAEHLARHDEATGGAIEAAEQGPGACDSDRCLMPQSK